MISRTLPLLNALGCLILAGLVLFQWRGERAAEQKLAALKSELAATYDRVAEESKRRTVLEHDITVLKDSLASLKQAADESAASFASKDELAGKLQADLDAARERLTMWEAALKARDERIRSLDADLTATRRHLDQAIAKLKAAGAR